MFGLFDLDDEIHPRHYRTPGGVQVIDLTEHMTFCLGNVVKYVFRCGRKEGASELEDLEKARFYLDREIARRRREHH